MITGFNTDIRHANVTFHVQTEDKGESVAWIESMVYVGGAIMGRRRGSYKSLLEGGLGSEAIFEMMKEQHRALIEEIHKGKFDADLPEGAATEPAPAPEAPESLLKRPTGALPSLDQVILEYLEAESEQEHLVLLMDSSAELVPGNETELFVRTRSSTSGEPIAGAGVKVRLISTAGEPRTLASGATDEEGELRLGVSLPEARQGTAALIVTAASEVGTAEIKQLL